MQGERHIAALQLHPYCMSLTLSGHLRASCCCAGVGYRFKLRHTRAIVDAIHSGELSSAEYENMPIFNLQVRLLAWLLGCLA